MSTAAIWDGRSRLMAFIRPAPACFLRNVKFRFCDRRIRMRTALDLNDLRLLSYVVDCGGFSAASRVLAIPTSTISQRIASLERAAGMGLLRRSTRRLSLTDAGKLMVPHARAIEEQVRGLQQTLQCLDGGPNGAIRVVSSNEIASSPLRRCLQNFPSNTRMCRCTSTR